MASSRRQPGFTYLTILFMVLATGIGLATFGEAWSRGRQREKEAELLWIGNQFRQAIGLYYERSPSGAKRYPRKLDDLLSDKRFLTIQRYLRRVYQDPITGEVEWDLIEAPDGGVMGVKSKSAAKPLGPMSSVSTYSSWQFIYEPPSPVARTSPTHNQ